MKLMYWLDQNLLPTRNLDLSGCRLTSTVTQLLTYRLRNWPSARHLALAENELLTTENAKKLLAAEE